MQSPDGPPARGLLDIRSLPREDIQQLLDRGREFQAIQHQAVKKLDALHGKSVVNLFFEPSTRTRTSFEIAAKRLGADTVSIVSEGSSLSKGESLVDTLNTVAAMRPDVIVMRHRASGAPHFLSRFLRIPIINGGDGQHEHPTQALLDAMTILDYRPSLVGLRVAIIGDIVHSRVARSNIQLLSKFGVKVVLCGPSTMVPPVMKETAPGVELTHDMNRAVEGADVIMMLRVQLERQKALPFPKNEYFRFFGLRSSHLKLAHADAIVMHPGPINRGREIASEIADFPRSVILNQVANGVALRMAVLERYCTNGTAGEPQ